VTFAGELEPAFAGDGQGNRPQHRDGQSRARVPSHTAPCSAGIGTDWPARRRRAALNLDRPGIPGRACMQRGRGDSEKDVSTHGLSGPSTHGRAVSACKRDSEAISTCHEDRTGMCVNMDFICSPIWVGWLVWMLYGPDREASLLTLQLHWSSTAIGYGPRSESGRYWADRADCRDLSGHSRRFLGSAASGGGYRSL
jgi:hypothetical protein